MTSPRRPVARRLRNSDQDRVSRLVAVNVVVVLEVVGVKKHDGDGVAGRACALQFQLQALIEEAEVVEAGQSVGDRPAVGPGDLSGQAPHDLNLL